MYMELGIASRIQSDPLNEDLPVLEELINTPAAHVPGKDLVHH